MLYGRLTMEQAIAGRSKILSVCIPEVLSRMGIIEQWGIGIQRMIQGCREYGVQKPSKHFVQDKYNLSMEDIGTAEKEIAQNWGCPKMA